MKFSEEEVNKNHDDIIHLGRGRRPYRITRGKNGEFLDIKEPVDEWWGSGDEDEL